MFKKALAIVLANFLWLNQQTWLEALRPSRQEHSAFDLRMYVCTSLRTFIAELDGGIHSQKTHETSLAHVQFGLH